MKQELSKHWLGYLILIAGSVFFAWVFLRVWPDRNLERMSILGYGIFYYLWGMVTHRSTHHLTPSVSREYGLVAVLGAALLTMLTF